jgi:hypothetical protein
MTEAGTRSPETGKLAIAFLVSLPQYSTITTPCLGGLRPRYEIRAEQKAHLCHRRYLCRLWAAATPTRLNVGKN